MAGGLFALLDDVAVLAKAAAASIDDVGAAAGRASAKAAGVIVDATAVTPRYVQGLAAERELPIIKRIAKGSLRNKLLIILPVALLLSQFLPWLLTPLLMLGGAYLCYEGVEKIWERIAGHQEAKESEAAETDEDTIVARAVRTDFILSAEIMVISLNTIANEPFVRRAITLVIVAIAITALVYGVVGFIVMMDDIGLSMSQKSSRLQQRFGAGLVAAMPKLLTTLSVVGVAAMIWVGGHILLVGFDELGFTLPYDLVHHVQVAAEGVGGIGGILGWIVNTIGSAILGVIVGAIIVTIMHFIPKRGAKAEAGAH